MNKQGSVLIFSLIFMLAMAALAVTLSVLFLNEIKISRNLGDSFKAYYAAESGMERSLGVIKTNRESGVRLEDTLATINGYDGIFVNDASYEITEASSDVSEITFYDLEPFETKQLDIFDPDTLASVLTSATNVYFKWPDNCQLEIILNEWQTGSWPGEGAIETRYTLNYPEAFLGLNVGYNYWLRLRPLNCSIASLDVSLTGSAIPGIISLKSQGTFSDVAQALQAQLPWRASAFDLADFSLFSESDIVK